MKRLLALAALGCCLTASATETLLNRKWSFRTDPLNEGLREAWYAPTHDLRGWGSMEVPGCWDTRLEYADYTGAAWYATEFVPEELPAGHEARLDFEGVYTDTEIFLNGIRLGSHDFGFTAFGFDVTDRLVPGRENRLVLRVDNSFKLGATWNWGGIRRPVRLRILPRERVDSIRVSAEPDLAHGSAEVGVRLLLCGGKPQRIAVEIADPEGKVVARREVRTSGQREELVSFRLRRARLWDFDHPNLYTVTATDGNGTAVRERFGIRRIEVDGYRLLLNGESVRLNGAQNEIKRAVEAGYWHMYRFNPTLKEEGKNPFTLDSKEPTASFRDFLLSEVRYSALQRTFPEVAEELFEQSEKNAKERLENYKRLANQ